MNLRRRNLSVESVNSETMYATVASTALHHHIQELFRRRILSLEDAIPSGVLDGHVVEVLPRLQLNKSDSV